MECLFCKIISGEIPCYKVYENEHVIAFLDIAPVSVGHTLIVPKVHASNLTEGPIKDAESVMRAIHMLGPAILEAVGAQGYNLGMNHGACAGQEVMHTHVHLMPRWEGSPRTFTKMRPSPEALKETAKKIRDVIA